MYVVVDVEDGKDARRLAVQVEEFRGHAAALVKVLADKADGPCFRHVVVKHHKGNFARVTGLEEVICLFVKDGRGKNSVGICGKDLCRERPERRRVVQVKKVRLHPNSVLLPFFDGILNALP